jgi:hypothetical protein
MRIRSRIGPACVAWAALWSVAAQAQVIPNMAGQTPYPQVRQALIEQGWTPVRQTQACGSVCSEHRRAGWAEAQECADTGVAPCVFVFRHTSGKLLEVVTRGETPRFNAFR